VLATKAPVHRGQPCVRCLRLLQLVSRAACRSILVAHASLCRNLSCSKQSKAGATFWPTASTTAAMHGCCCTCNKTSCLRHSEGSRPVQPVQT